MKNFKNLFLALITCTTLTTQLAALDDAYFHGADLDLTQENNQMLLFNRVSQPGAPVNALEDWLSHPEYLTARSDYLSEKPMHSIAVRSFDSDPDLATRLHNAGVAAGIDVLDVTDDAGRTPLFLAIMSEDGREMVARLIDLGADINIPDMHGITPLDEAQDRANLLETETAFAIVDLLIDAGAHHSADYGLEPA